MRQNYSCQWLLFSSERRSFVGFPILKWAALNMCIYRKHELDSVGGGCINEKVKKN